MRAGNVEVELKERGLHFVIIVTVYSPTIGRAGLPLATSQTINKPHLAGSKEKLYEAVQGAALMIAEHQAKSPTIRANHNTGDIKHEAIEAMEQEFAEYGKRKAAQKPH
jgi:hypothetical protein